MARWIYIKATRCCADALKDLFDIGQLDLSHCFTTDDGAKRVAEIIRATPHLMDVKVYEQGLTAKGAQ